MSLIGASINQKTIVESAVLIKWAESSMVVFIIGTTRKAFQMRVSLSHLSQTYMSRTCMSLNKSYYLYITFFQDLTNP